MTARSIGNATISFGLIAVPIKVYTSEQSVEDLHFNLLHDADNARLKQQYTCTQCGEVVDKEHTHKGYEHAKGQWVVFTQDELDALDSVATNLIDLDGFVPGFDPLYVEKTYYLGPDKGAEKPYALLARVLENRNLVGIGRWSTRGKEHPVVVRPFEDGLAIHQLRYQREVKPWSEVPARSEVKLSPAEIALGEQLVDQMEQDEIDFGRYADRVHERRKALIQQKIDHGAITVVPGDALPPAPIDLMASLKASLDQAPKKVKPIRKVAAKKAGKPAKRRRAA